MLKTVTQPVLKELFTIETTYGPKELKTGLKRDVGTMSRKLDEGHFWETMAVSSSNDNGLNWLNKGTWAGQSTPGVEGRNILDFISMALSTKNYKKIAQSLFEKTSTGGGSGFTKLLIVLNTDLGFFLLQSIKLEK